MVGAAVLGAVAALSLTGAHTASSTRAQTEGPRPLPPTFVPLELAKFPRPAAEACRDNTRIVSVHPPQGIAHALEAARPGTTILAAPGTYVEQRGSPYSLQWNVANVCLRPTGGKAVVKAAPGQKYGLTITAGDAVVEGVTLRGFSDSIVLDAEKKTIRRVTFERLRIEPAGKERGGIVAWGDNRSRSGQPPTVDGLLVLDSRMGAVDLGISCNGGPCAHWWIEGTTVQGRGGPGEQSGADTFAVESGRQIVVLDSTVDHSSSDGVDTKATDVVVFGVRVLDASRNGVKLWHGGDVIDTVIDGSDADAALVGNGDGRYRYLHDLVRRHALGGSAYVGTWNYGSKKPVRLEIVNSIVAGNGPGGGLYVPVGSTVSIRHSIFADRDSKLLELSNGKEWEVSELQALEEAGFGAENSSADPQLVTTGPNRWSTRAGSPARDRAEPIPGLTRDLYGNPRVIGDGPDIGPVESS